MGLSLLSAKGIPGRCPIGVAGDGDSSSRWDMSSEIVLPG